MPSWGEIINSKIASLTEENDGVVYLTRDGKLETAFALGYLVGKGFAYYLGQHPTKGETYKLNTLGMSEFKNN